MLSFDGVSFGVPDWRRVRVTRQAVVVVVSIFAAGFMRIVQPRFSLIFLYLTPKIRLKSKFLVNPIELNLKLLSSIKSPSNSSQNLQFQSKFRKNGNRQ